MRSASRGSTAFEIALLFSCLVLSSGLTAQAIRLHVDLTDAPRNIYHAHLQIPVHAGEMALVFPKWIPGNHRPSGPIGALTGIRMEAAGQPISWRRDDLEMYEFHVTVPAGVKLIDVSLDAITSRDSAGANGPAASSNILDLNWNAVLLYPKGSRSDDVTFAPSITLPTGWKFGTALPVARNGGDDVEFAEVPLTTLIDSPVIAGEHYRQINLTKPEETPVHVMDLVAEAEPDLAMSPQDLAAYQKLVAETGALFGTRHYRQYHFLLTLSDLVGEHGLEHHQSSDDRVPEKSFLDPNLELLIGGLLPHEFTHSWNGKYRRPAGLATPNYQVPMKGDLLWVYEGLTDYLGNILAARTGLRSPDQFRENLAYTAAMLDHRAGRTWRPLQDTATSVQSIFTAPPEWTNWRRSADYYPEGYLIWLEVDALLRQKSNGQKSLNDFCRAFHGGESGPPKVVPYNFEDVVVTLNRVVPNDWARLLRERLDSKSPQAPLGGITGGGWKLVYTAQKNTFMDAIEKGGDWIDLSFSLGLMATKEGEVRDVIPGTPAYAAGLAPGMKIIAVNGRKWSKDIVRAALQASLTNQKPIALLGENGEYYSTYAVDYHQGERYPHLVRVEGQPNLLDEIIKPLGN